MEKAHIGGDGRGGRRGGGRGGGKGRLTLDHCPRCGGMWFELGEVQQLSSRRPESLWSQVPSRAERHAAQCHSCRAFIDRDEEKCGACGAKTRLNCPACDRRMSVRRHSDLTLDVCKRCKGVWFDHHEIEAIWKLERGKLVGRQGERGDVARDAGEGAADVLAETLFWAPELVFLGAHVAGHAVAAAARHAPSALEAAGEAAGAAAEHVPEVLGAVGDAAGSVFEAVLEIVSGIFN